MIKDIIVNLDLGARDCAGDFALSVAETFDAHVLGVAVAYDPIISGSIMGGIPTQFIDSWRAESEKKTHVAIGRFEQAAKRAGISAEGVALSTDISSAASQLGAMARRFDLAVVGQPEPEKSIAEEGVGEAVLFESGRPVIMVPYIQQQGLKLDRVMVCWDGGRAASRAIADSMPFLAKAKQIEVVLVAGNPAKSDEISGADLGQHLARHGLKINVKRLVAPDIDVTSAMLSYAADSSADMIVMGGYGHSRLREFVLGGVTRGILATMTVPTLMSH
jgi:nucleotide-binding universal stress UspA family protein